MRHNNRARMIGHDSALPAASMPSREVARYLEESKTAIERAPQAGILQIPLAGHFLQMIWWILPHDSNQDVHNRSCALSTETFRILLRDALEHYHITAHLAASELHQYLNLEAHCNETDVATLADGFALRRALDQVLDAMCNFPPSAAKTLRNEQYLDLHYRKLIDDKELAKRYHFSTRHLRRIRDEQIAIASEMLLRYNPRV